MHGASCVQPYFQWQSLEDLHRSMESPITEFQSLGIAFVATIIVYFHGNACCFLLSCHLVVIPGHLHLHFHSATKVNL